MLPRDLGRYRHAGMDITLTTEYQDKGYGSEALRLWPSTYLIKVTTA